MSVRTRACDDLRAAYASYLPIPFPPMEAFPSHDQWERLADIDYELAGWVTRMLRGEPAQFDLFVARSAEVRASATMVTGVAEAYCIEMLCLLEAARPLLLGPRAS